MVSDRSRSVSFSPDFSKLESNTSSDWLYSLSHNPFPKRQILDSSKLKEFADELSKFDENLENSMGKGEIARYKRFLLLSQCFRKTCTADM